MRRRILLTGASGFMGHHMARLLKERGYDVSGIQPDLLLPCPEGVQPILADLLNPSGLRDVPKEWDGVIHLAAMSLPSQFKDPTPVLHNVAMTLNLLEHLAPTRVLLVSSAHVYAPSLDLHHENEVLHPQGLYGLSKHLTEQVAPHYRHRLDIRVARPFNHIGPGMRPELMIPSLIRRLAALDPADAAPVRMSGTNSIRDFIDVRDVATAYLHILELDSPEAPTFNVCSGAPCSIESVVTEALDILGQPRKVQFQEQPTSGDDIPFLVGSPERLHGTHWRPHYSLRESLQSLFASTPEHP